VAEAVGGGAGGAVERGAYEEADQAAEGAEDDWAGLGPASPASGEDFGGDGVEEGLRAEGDADEAEAGDGRVDGVCAGQDDAADSAG
jgi:hypothetical protein